MISLALNILEHDMTLKSALYTIKKNPTSLLKRDNDIYFVSEKHFSDVPYAMGICNGLTP